MEASSFGFCQMACVFKARIIPQFLCLGNLQGVAGFNKQTELYRYKCRSNRLSNSNVKVLTY